VNNLLLQIFSNIFSAGFGAESANSLPLESLREIGILFTKLGDSDIPPSDFMRTSAILHLMNLQAEHSPGIRLVDLLTDNVHNGLAIDPGLNSGAFGYHPYEIPLGRAKRFDALFLRLEEIGAKPLAVDVARIVVRAQINFDLGAVDRDITINLLASEWIVP